MAVSIPINNLPQELVFKEVEGKPLYLTFLPPKRKVFKRAPVFAVISGGGWYEQSRQAILDMYHISCDLLREAGACVVSADYRVVSLFPDANAGQEVGDVLDAMAYLRKYADVLEIDPGRIALTGHSAGGHITALMAYAPPGIFPTDYPAFDLPFAGCVPFSAPCFLYPSEPWSQENQKAFIHIFPDNVYDDALAHQWSPYDHISAQSPPTLFVHGDADALIPVSNSLRSYERGRHLGADFTMIKPANGGHALEAMQEGIPVEPSYEAVQREIAAWVRDWLKI